MSIATTLVFSLFTSGAGGPSIVQDLCDVVNTNGASLFCEPHRVDAPVLNQDVCCDADSCALAGTASCSAGQDRYHCDLGEVDAANDVTCYFEAVDYCDAFECPAQGEVQAPPDPQADFICCYYGNCIEYHFYWDFCETGHVYWCFSPVCTDDGWVQCADWD